MTQTQTTLKVTPKFNRCLEFTLPDGQTVVCKVLGDKAVASANAKVLLQALGGK